MLSVNLLSAIVDLVFWSLVSCNRFLGARGSDTSITKSHRATAGIPSNLRPNYCVTQLFASFKPSLLEQVCGFRKYRTFHLTLMSSLSDHQQSRHPRINPICILL